MRQSLVVYTAIVLLLVLAVAPVAAIGNGEIDTTHPNVGVMVVEFESGIKEDVCSGSLLAPTVFLTAAHCLAFLSELNIAADRVYVTFDVNLLSATTFVQATAYHFHPSFGHDTADLYDVGVIILSQPVTAWNGASLTPVTLASAGLLDELAARGGLRGRSFVNVGYGVVPHHKGAPPSFEFDGYRRVSTSPFKALTKAYLQLLMNVDATGEGGSCYGDSGSPKFLPDTNVVVALTTGGDAVCRAHNYNYRLDTPTARTFLSQFVTLPMLEHTQPAEVQSANYGNSGDDALVTSKRTLYLPLIRR